MPPTVFRADAQHLDVLAPLFDGYRRFYRQPSDLAAARRFLADRLAADESVIFAAALPEADGLAGFTQLYPFFSSVRMRRVWVLNDLYVAPGARRQGVARALMDAAHAFDGRRRRGPGDRAGQRLRAGALRRPRLPARRRVLALRAHAVTAPCLRLAL